MEGRAGRDGGGKEVGAFLVTSCMSPRQENDSGMVSLSKDAYRKSIFFTVRADPTAKGGKTEKGQTVSPKILATYYY